MSAIEKTSPIFFINPVRSPLLWTFIAAHSFVAVFLGKIYAFAPDEAGYLEIYKHVYEKNFSTASILGWSNCQPLVLRIFYLPAKGLEIVGVPDYLAIRFLAVLTSTFALYLLICVYRSVGTALIPRSIVLAFATPSVFLWMSLGLRESFVYLGLAITSSGFYLFSTKHDAPAFFFMFIGNLILFETKSYLFLLALISSVILIIVLFARRGNSLQRSGYLAMAVLLPLMINPQGVKYLSDSIKLQLDFISSTGGSSTASVADTNATSASESVATTVSGLKSALTSQPDSLFSRTLLGLGIKNEPTPVAIPGTPSTPAPVNTYDTSRLNVSPANFRSPLSIVARSAGFLFTPFPFIDNGSLFLNMASFESPFWWFLYIGFGLAVWRRYAKRKVDELTIFIFSFSALFVLFSAFTEINVGTMARHRSVLVIPILVLMLATPRKRFVT
ncbi:MAG: hypothetical protein Q8L08_11225 [Candidatus Nanopelagicaceae bacterium]|nr:hypothetical protein [Candidatus Nanopelagicaceae bacterium]